MTTDAPILAPDEQALGRAAESVLLVAGGPVSYRSLALALETTIEMVDKLVGDLAKKHQGGIRIQVHRGHVQLVTAPESREAVQRYLGAARPPAFSRAALEALTVVAYRQPVTRAEIEAARGVNSDRAIHTLLARGLIEEVGQRQVIGRPMQYGTGFAFLEYFGLSSLADLPRIDQLEPPQADPTAIGMRTSAGQSRLLDGDEGATG